MDEDSAHDLYLQFKAVDAGARQKQGLGFASAPGGDWKCRDAPAFVRQRSRSPGSLGRGRAAARARGRSPDRGGSSSSDGDCGAEDRGRRSSRRRSDGDGGRSRHRHRRRPCRSRSSSSRESGGRQASSRRHGRSRGRSPSCSRSRSRSRRRRGRSRSRSGVRARSRSPGRRRSRSRSRSGRRGQESKSCRHHDDRRRSPRHRRHSDDRSRGDSGGSEDSGGDRSARSGRRGPRDYAKLIPGFESMSAMEKVKARTRLTLDDTSRADNRSSNRENRQWTRFVFNSSAPLEEEGARPEIGFDGAGGGTLNSVSFRSGEAEALAKARDVDHAAAIFGVSKGTAVSGQEALQEPIVLAEAVVAGTGATGRASWRQRAAQHHQQL